MKEFFLHKLTLRGTYILGAYTASHLIALAASPKVLGYFTNAGISLKITDPGAFKTAITAGLLFVGEFVYEWAHNKFVMPHVNPMPLPPVVPK